MVVVICCISLVHFELLVRVYFGLTNSSALFTVLSLLSFGIWVIAELRCKQSGKRGLVSTFRGTLPLEAKHYKPTVSIICSFSTVTIS